MLAQQLEYIVAELHKTLVILQQKRHYVLDSMEAVQVNNIVYIRKIHCLSFHNIGIYDMTSTVNYDLNGDSPQFTLTCISTGGPATTVTWTRDSTTTVTERTLQTVLRLQSTSILL